MATAAVQGSLFASPGSSLILSAIDRLWTETCGVLLVSMSIFHFEIMILCLSLGGILLVVNNYTGDRLNFGLALERAKARGIKVFFFHISC